MKKKNEVKIFEAFAGVGAQYKALKNISTKKNWDVKSVGIIEWFLPAIICYQAIHYENMNVVDETFEWKVRISLDSKKPCSEKWKQNKLIKSKYGYWLNRSKNVANNLFDISSINLDMIPKNIDIFTYSFPCQDISNQGKQKGFLKNSNTRSGLLWEIEKILYGLKLKNENFLPKYLLMENVKAIINSKHISTFNLWLKKLNELGYESKTYILNSSNFNSPQNRERVFVLSVLKKYKSKVNFEFSDLEKIKNKKISIKEIIDTSNNSLFYFLI